MMEEFQATTRIHESRSDHLYCLRRKRRRLVDALVPSQWEPGYVRAGDPQHRTEYDDHHRDPDQALRAGRSMGFGCQSELVRRDRLVDVGDATVNPRETLSATGTTNYGLLEPIRFNISVSAAGGPRPLQHPYSGSEFPDTLFDNAHALLERAPHDGVCHAHRSHPYCYKQCLCSLYSKNSREVGLSSIRQAMPAENLWRIQRKHTGYFTKPLLHHQTRSGGLL